jgi:hypothetical protein
MTATYFILMDLKSRNKSIRLLPNRIQQTNPIPANLLREKNQEITPRSRTTHRHHPPPADLLLISQQDKTYLPPTSGTNNEYRNYKTPNKENSQPQNQKQTTPTVT